MVDYVHTTGAQLLRFTLRGKEACFFLPLFMSLFQHIETGGLRGCCDASQNSCVHERVFIFLFTCKFEDFFTLSALNLLLLL